MNRYPRTLLGLAALSVAVFVAAVVPAIAPIILIASVIMSGMAVTTEATVSRGHP